MQVRAYWYGANSAIIVDVADAAGAATDGYIGCMTHTELVRNLQFSFIAKSADVHAHVSHDQRAVRAPTTQPADSTLRKFTWFCSV